MHIVSSPSLLWVKKAALCWGNFCPAYLNGKDRPERVESEKTAERLERLEGLEGLEGLAFSGQPRACLLGTAEGLAFSGHMVFRYHNLGVIFIFKDLRFVCCVYTVLVFWRYINSVVLLDQVIFIICIHFPTLWNGRLSANPHSCWSQRRDCCLSAHVYVLLILQNAHLASLPPLLVIAHSKYWWMKSLW